MEGEQQGYLIDILEAVETDVKERFDTIVQNGYVELSWTDIEDQIHEETNFSRKFGGTRTNRLCTNYAYADLILDAHPW